jgi:glycosyltransferase involved in cell wall biosynthesis
MRELRLLTFNWHETYLSMLTSLGHRWDVVPRKKGGRTDWWAEVRPQPTNVDMIPEEEALDRLAAGDYDAVICHNLLDLGLVVDSDVPTVTIFHTSRDLEVTHGLDLAAFDRYGRPLLARSTPVFVSEMKQSTWEVDGHVIPPGIDLTSHDGYTGDAAIVLHVGNLKRELASVNGMADLEKAVGGLPFTLLGLNPSIPGARLSRDWDDLKSHFRNHRAYIHTTRMPYEDGYNLAMLEAMATGMPVVTLEHPTSPVEDGVSGLVGKSSTELAMGLLELLEDHARARELGIGARRRVAERFPFGAFQSRWRDVLEKVAA